MHSYRSIGSALAFLSLLGACATNPEFERVRQEQDQEIALILTEPSDRSKYDEPRRCLRPHEHRNFKVLDERRIIFEGRRDQLWLNQLRGRCPGLRSGHALKFGSDLQGGRICYMDSFEVMDFFFYPRFFRWPWYWFNGVRCTLGKFEPITELQAQAIKAALKHKQIPSS